MKPVAQEEAELLAAEWAASERAHERKRREENRLAWIEHYRGLVRAHISLARDARRRMREMQTTKVEETA